MFQIFWEEPIITAGIGGFWIFSFLTRILLGLAYRSMIQQSDNMAITNNRMLKQCKLKFANCYELNNGVPNIPVFVDKFLNRLSIGPFSFETLYHLSGQSMLLSVIFSGAGICAAIMRGHTVGDILPFYITSFLGLYLYFAVSSMVDIRGKKRILKVNLVDYLENHLAARISVTENDMRMLYGDAAQGGRKASKRRRTLELMPIGNRNASEWGEIEELEELNGTDGMVVGGAPSQAAWPEEPSSMRVRQDMPQVWQDTSQSPQGMPQERQSPQNTPQDQQFMSEGWQDMRQGQQGRPQVDQNQALGQPMAAQAQPGMPQMQQSMAQPQPVISLAAHQGAQKAQPISQPAVPASSQASPFYISGEELEALIKEFC